MADKNKDLDGGSAASLNDTAYRLWIACRDKEVSTDAVTMIAEVIRSARDENMELLLDGARSLLNRTMALYAPDMVGTASGKALLLNICEWIEAVAASDQVAR